MTSCRRVSSILIARGYNVVTTVVCSPRAEPAQGFDANRRLKFLQVKFELFEPSRLKTIYRLDLNRLGSFLGLS